MSGRLQVVGKDEERALHTHVVWTLADGRELRYVDARRFGTIVVVDRGRELRFDELANLGIDPLGPAHTKEALAALAKQAKRSAKAFLLDQSKIAGLGNIYVCEALYEAGIHPHARVSKLSNPRIGKLHKAIVSVLERGIRNRGTTFRDYTDAQGKSGNNQQTLRVYGREGLPCHRRDGGTVRRVSTQGRGTFFCPRCQLR
jgi:formamidopyrimidine-DNA glycosylase